VSATSHSLEQLAERVRMLEARVAQLEGGAGQGRRRPNSGSSGAAASVGGSLDTAGWTSTYVAAELQVSETWIEVHEQSARPQLQRLIRQVVEEEGPVTDRLVLDRVRRAWGLRRAGGRVQEAYDQAVRQLLARSLVERDGDALRIPGSELQAVRVPGEDEASRRAAEDVPVAELALAIVHAVRALGPTEADELTMQVARLFGWTRRGGSIQMRLDAAVEAALERGTVERRGSRLAVAAAG